MKVSVHIAQVTTLLPFTTTVMFYLFTALQDHYYLDLLYQIIISVQGTFSHSLKVGTSFDLEFRV